ncbi:thiamine/molybdopterin biosynthesis protein [Desulforhopalus sp. 52FAK]
MLLDGRHSVEEIAEQLTAKEDKIEIDKILKMIDRFDKQLLLENVTDPHQSNLPYYDRERYSRQLLYFAGFERNGIEYSLLQQHKIKTCHVLLLGAGGFGCHVFDQLISCGFGKITVVDYDTIELSNLNRQSMYGHNDIDRPKLDVLREQALRQNPHIEYRFLNRKITSTSECAEIMQGCDFVINCIDTPREKIFTWINEASYQTSVPVLFGLGALKNSIAVGPIVVPGTTICFNCSMPPEGVISFDDPLIKKINEQHQHGIIIPYIMMATGMMVNETLKHVTGHVPCLLYNRRISLNLYNYEKTEEIFTPRRECSFCAGIEV